VLLLVIERTCRAGSTPHPRRCPRPAAKVTKYPRGIEHHIRLSSVDVVIGGRRCGRAQARPPGLVDDYVQPLADCVRHRSIAYAGRKSQEPGWIPNRQMQNVIAA
jgi:hypothetical protein